MVGNRVTLKTDAKVAIVMEQFIRLAIDSGNNIKQAWMLRIQILLIAQIKAWKILLKKMFLE